MAYDIFSVLHNFFYFLSTNEGVLFRAATELIIFLIVTYMIVSEYLREKNSEHKYLSIAFASLALHRFITVFVFSHAVFGEIPLPKIESFMPVVLHFLEIFAFVLLSNAFVYPYRKDSKKLLSVIEIETLSLFIISVLIEVLWLNSLKMNSEAVFSAFYGFAVFSIIKVIILIRPLFIILKHKMEFRYEHNIISVFAVYAMVPLLQSLNFFFYNNQNPKLEVFLNPFPFISVMLFTKVIYLKLVDKAILKDKLRLSEEKYRAAKELGEMKDGFVSVVSHELRTPLTSMKLYAKLLESGKFGKTTDKQKKAVSIINQETDRLSALIEDILHLSKLESKKETINAGAFDFHEFAVNHHIYELARENGITVKVSIPKKFIMYVDGEKFKQVFINLIGNAIKFTEKGGTITVNAMSEKNHWSISIRDTGKGIAKENIPKLFDKFFQVESYMTRDKGGIGLGLAIAKHIVDLHNGDIKVESELGKGSSFTVIIPKSLETEFDS